MKWVSHIAISGITTAVVAPQLVPLAVLGGTAPDWLEWVAKAGGGNVQHRKQTHYFSHWLILFAVGFLVIDFNGFVKAFAWGGITHILADAVTITGVPFSPLSDRRFHLFGGRLRTGSPQEYLIVGGFTAVFAGIFVLTHRHIGGDGGFLPFFYDWGGYYADGIIDAAEWKKNRFRIF